MCAVKLFNTHYFMLCIHIRLVSKQQADNCRVTMVACCQQGCPPLLQNNTSEKTVLVSKSSGPKTLQMYYGTVYYYHNSVKNVNWQNEPISCWSLVHTTFSEPISKKSCLDAIQKHPQCRTRFGQYRYMHTRLHFSISSR